MFMNKNKVHTPGNSLDFETKLLKWWGVYPIRGEKIADAALYYTKGTVAFTISMLFFFSIWYNIYYHMDDSAIVIETLYFGLTQTTFVCKLINVQVRGNDLKGIVDYLSLPVFNLYDEEQYRYILAAMKKTQIFAIWYRGAVTVTIIFFSIFPFLEGSYLPLPSYFPKFMQDYHIVCFLCQMTGIIINGYCHSSMDVVVTTLISIGSAQFDILKDNLTNFRKGLDDLLENRMANDVICTKRLKTCVMHHVTTIEFAYSIESVFSIVQFIQFLASSIIICVTGFQIIVTPITDVKFITLTLYFLCNLIQVTMCCWFGHDILTTSEGVGEACYMSDWYNSGSSVGRTLFIIMERSKRPVALTAGKFFYLSLQTLMQVLKTSYSYLALLRRMNEVREL